jgi:hypothetical protein
VAHALVPQFELFDCFYGIGSPGFSFIPWELIGLFERGWGLRDCGFSEGRLLIIVGLNCSG